MTAEIDDIYEFEAIERTASTPKDGKEFIGMIGVDSLYAFSLTFPIYCGEVSYELPNPDKNVSLSINNIDCKTGKITITNYDINLVEGSFEFDIYIDSLVQIKNGKFLLIHKYI